MCGFYLAKVVSSFRSLYSHEIVLFYTCKRNRRIQREETTKSSTSLDLCDGLFIDCFRLLELKFRQGTEKAQAESAQVHAHHIS